MQNKPSAIGLDIDGTLVEKWTSVFLPKVLDRINEIPQDVPIYLCTNQAGPAWRRQTGELKYPDERDIAVRLSGIQFWVSQWAGRAVPVYVATHTDGVDSELIRESTGMLHAALATVYKNQSDPRPFKVEGIPHWRKPGTGMLHHAAARFRFEIKDSLFIGDADSDEACAKAAGARFIWAHDWAHRGIWSR